MKDISSFIDNLQDLIDSKKLLDNILQYYSVYGNEFDNKRLQEMDKVLESAKLYKNTISSQIRSYIKFDDSE